MVKTLAAISAGDGQQFVLEQVELDGPRDDEILVRIAAVGLCHTDVVAHQGAFQFGVSAVLGHEGAGTVLAVGNAVKKIKTGDRVAISFRSCGRCSKCHTGHPAYCHTMPALNYIGRRTDGSRAIRRGEIELASNFFGQSSFATHALTYEQNVVKIPSGLPFDVAAPLGCGIQTGVGSIVNALSCEPGSSLLITGGGTVGLSAVLGGRLKQCEAIVVVEPHAARRSLAIEFGATHTIDPGETPDLASAIRAILPIGADYAFDTTGRDDVLSAIMASLAPQGALGCVGIPNPESRVPGELLKLVTFGHRVMGIIEGDSNPQTFIPELIRHFRAGRMPFDRMITRYPMHEINRAVADQAAGRCVKPVLIVDDSAA